MAKKFNLPVLTRKTVRAQAIGKVDMKDTLKTLSAVKTRQYFEREKGNNRLA